ncbi:MAG: hypothetical protein WDM88_00215 [Galbitalea sp.]
MTWRLSLSSALPGSVLPVIATVPGAAGFRVALELDQANAFVESWDVDATLVVKVQRILKAGEKYLVGDPFGGILKLMPEETRTSILDSLNSPELGQLGISGRIRN